MGYDYFRKELSHFYVENDLSNVTHLFDSKDIIIETIRGNDNLRRRTRSEKFSNLAYQTLNFSTPTSLTFEHTRAVGARASEKKILEWWSLSIPHYIFLEYYNNYFTD